MQCIETNNNMRAETEYTNAQKQIWNRINEKKIDVLFQNYGDWEEHVDAYVL